jgi:phage recombination protein Bet
MDNAIAVKEPEQISIADVKKYIAPNATDKELFFFMGICKSYGLNPLKREIHFVKYGNAAASIIVGYEIYLKRAERTGKLDGWKCWIEKDEIGEKAVIEIKRKDQSTPIKWEVYRKEFDKQQSTWKAMPTFMLKKVAIAQGFRLAFPEDLGGIPYIPEELPAASTNQATSEGLDKHDVIVDAEQPPDVPDFVPPTSPNRYDEPPQEEHNVDDIVIAKIEDVDSKEGETKGRAWKVFFIKTATGGKYATFDTNIADMATTCMNNDELVKLRWEYADKAKTKKQIIELGLAA